MELNRKNRNLPTLVNQINNGKFNFKHPLQRKPGQWNSLMKSELIDSVLRDFAIDPVTIVSTMLNKETGEVESVGNAVIDGIQRMTYFADFFNGNFKLSKRLENSPFVIDGEEFLPSEHLWGKKYDDLDDRIKQKLSTCDLSLDIYSSATSEEIRELFRRKNSGKPLTAAQKNSLNISDDLYEKVRKVLTAEGTTIKVERKNRSGATVEKEKKLGNFWDRSLSATIFKNSEDRNLVLQTMMLVSNYGQDHEFGFKNDDVQEFALWFDQLDENTSNTLIDAVISGADAINTRMQNKIKNLTKTSIPMVVAGMCKVDKHKGSKTKYMELVLDFFENYDANESYKALLKEGTASKESVSARWEVFKGIARSC